jgi:DNA-binding SARP family transcriptional activator
VEFRILGPLDIRHEGRAVELRGAKQRALLAVLLLHANEVVSIDRLVDELWGDASSEAGTAALRVRISELRKALDVSGLGSPIVTRQAGYLLEVESDQLDLVHFERLVAEAESAEPAAAADKLRAALRLWRGLPLADFAYEQFAQTAIARLEELRLTVLERRIEADLALGRHADLVGELEALVRQHPLRERFCGQLMVALYRSGRQAEALKAYRAARRTLVDELGIEPTSALQELERAILRQDPSLDVERLPASSRSILVVAMGEDRLDDLLALARPLTRRPSRELILARMVTPEALGRTAGRLNEVCKSLLARGVAARSAVFTTTSPGEDAVRLAREQDVELMLMDGGPAPLEDPTLRTMLEQAPCDVAVLVPRGRSPEPGPVLVPFAGGEHDWAAVELGAWIAGSQGVPLRLAGPAEKERDASRLLASASLAVQRALGVAAAPLLVEPGAAGLLQAAEGASLVVVGLSDRWGREGLGAVRHALTTGARAPVVLVRRGLRPGGLAPQASLTRFTWSIAPAHP